MYMYMCTVDVCMQWTANLNATMKGECSDFVLYTKKAPSLWSRFRSCSACDSDLTPLCNHLMSGWSRECVCVCEREKHRVLNVHTFTCSGNYSPLHYKSALKKPHFLKEHLNVYTVMVLHSTLLFPK